jgi:hypothetical protein
LQKHNPAEQQSHTSRPADNRVSQGCVFAAWVGLITGRSKQRVDNLKGSCRRELPWVVDAFPLALVMSCSVVADVDFCSLALILPKKKHMVDSIHSFQYVTVLL